MIVCFLSCRERFRLKYVLGLEPHDKWNHRLGYGNMWHVCEEEHAVGHGHKHKLSWYTNHRQYPFQQHALTWHTNQMCRQYPFQKDEITKWYNVCAVQFPEYIKYWSEHPDVLNRTPLLQEQVFDVPYQLPSGRTVRLRGKWDSVDEVKAHTDNQGREWPAGIWLQENKTKGDINKEKVERQLKFDLQTMMYLVALKEIEDISPMTVNCWPVDWRQRILGVRYNVVRRPLSGGKGSIVPHKVKYTKNKFTPAETMEKFYERLRRDYLAAEPDYWFFRIRVEITAQDIKVFRETCLDPLLDTICDWYEDITGRMDITINDYKCSNYRTPFGVYSSLEEGGATEYDAYLATGSEAGLRHIEELFTELK
jgi:hypothetical protein